ncbi:hypothetical protein [Marinomonas colpomeniae]|uniref:Uncharacterized protein n=1 Tax=Marinomonas colpomeniae TaxID=2774408 RepID=A0ABR8P1E0_9GAMM|nr:hypothetical protein [Marinomonas colpomeniae]MBD5772107.1 hypothetical protein [Marinomonas colpomeniae]
MTNKSTNFNVFVSGSVSNLLGQTTGLVVDEAKSNGLKFNFDNIDLGEIDFLQAGVSGAASGASSVFKAQPTLGRILMGDVSAGLFVGVAESSVPEYTVNDLFSIENNVDQKLTRTGTLRTQYLQSL